MRVRLYSALVRLLIPRAVVHHLVILTIPEARTAFPGICVAALSDLRDRSIQNLDNCSEKSLSQEPKQAELLSFPELSQSSPSYSIQDRESPPPPYTESLSPLVSFTFCMAAAGGSSSIITQVQQGAPHITSLSGIYLRIRQIDIADGKLF